MPQAATGFSPFELVFGRQVRGPLDILKEGWEASKRVSESVISHVLSLREQHLELMSELVKEYMSEAQQKQKVWHDQTAWMRELRPKDQVLVLLLTTHNKLLAKWQGPYTVIRRMGKVTYEVDIPGSRSRRKIFHINLLKNWYESYIYNYIYKILCIGVGAGPAGQVLAEPLLSKVKMKLHFAKSKQ